MLCQYLNDPKLITAYGPFLAAFFTGLITIIAVMISSNATRRASKIQSEATLSSVSKSLSFEAKNQKLKLLHEALSECLAKLYLIARDPNVFMQDTEAIFLVITKFDTLLSTNYNEIKIKKLLSTLMDNFVYKGDVNNVREIIQEIKKETNVLIEEINKNE